MSETITKQRTQLFELEPGKYLDLQINHPVSMRLKLALIGYEIGNYIILKYPKVASKTEYNDVFFEGNSLIIRYLMPANDGECFAFRSTIKYISQYPARLLFIKYPSQIENRQLRMQARTNIHLPATIIIEDSSEIKAVQLNGIINNISSKGCGFSFKAQNINANLDKQEILVSIQSPTIGDIIIPGRICNSRNNQATTTIGIQFIDKTNIVPKLLKELLIDSSAN